MLDPTKTYKLRNAPDRRLVSPVQIAAPDSDGNYATYPIAARVEYVGGTGPSHWLTWTPDGKFCVSDDASVTDLDLVEDVPEWHNWPIDAKVLARTSGYARFIRCHYAGEKDGRPTVWMDGHTSWSVLDFTMPNGVEPRLYATAIREENNHE